MRKVDAPESGTCALRYGAATILGEKGGATSEGNFSRAETCVAPAPSTPKTHRRRRGPRGARPRLRLGCVLCRDLQRSASLGC